METIAQRYQRLRDTFLATVAAVPPDRWDDPSPCEDWTARDVVAHVVATQGTFETLVGRSLEPGPDVADDPEGALRTATDQVQQHLEDPATAGVEFDGMLGRRSFEDAVNNFLGLDLIVHRWDLARATGVDETILDVDIAWVREATGDASEMIRSEGVCGPEVPVGPDASEQDQMLAYLGRRP